MRAPPTSQSPIGVFDSGVGGLSVLKAIQARLPDEAFLYVADSANAPYGDRDASFITARTMALAEFLVESGAKAIVVACNTATVVAVETLRSRFPLPIIALEPAIKPAAATTRTGVIAVMATSRTLESAQVTRLCSLYGSATKIILQACPGLVEQVENGEIDSEATLLLLKSYVHPMVNAGADTIVLGCTHYSFLSPQIQAFSGESVRLIDSAGAVARQVQRRINPADPTTISQIPQTSFFTTGNPEQASARISRLWETAVEVKAVTLPISAEET